MTCRIKIFFICYTVFAVFGATKAQPVVSLNEGLIVGPCHQYGREAIYYDQLAYQLYCGTLKSPKAGQSLFTDEKGQTVVWRKIMADHSGLFMDTDISNSYIYLTHHSGKEEVVLLKATGNSMFYFNGEPHAGDIYSSNWLYIPVKLKKGLNELYLRASRNSEDGISARMIVPEKRIMINTEDLTLPIVVLGESNDSLLGALVIINCTEKPLTGLEIQTRIEGKDLKTRVPVISPLSIRKVGFRFNGDNLSQKGQYDCKVTLFQKGKLIDEKIIQVVAVHTNEHYSNTFISDIDGSVQYFSVCPQSNNTGNAPALFLSVHGAGVEAIGQARAYQPKDWGVLVAPTNRRPRGFNWEDWGRLDAFEVLDLATEKFNPDPERIYLTGHSMGGHGTWYLGSTFPGKWAAIAPCSGYATLVGYGSADGKIPATGGTTVENMLLRASNGSNVIELAKNCNAGGVYILHGDSDKVVSVDYARQMKKLLASTQKDFSYYEYPGGSHWFGNQCVDWPPIFEYFKWHTIHPDSTVNIIDFTTANPAVSSSCYWTSVLQQVEPLKYSHLRADRSMELKTIRVKTGNISLLGLSLADFRPGEMITLEIDDESLKYEVSASGTMIYLHLQGKWQIGKQPDPDQKGSVRNGTFKEPFNYRMVFVYGTLGNEQENSWAAGKARYDAETWYYRGNGSVDVVADKEFDPAQYPDRGVIIYGNATTNGAWNKLLSMCPVQVQRGSLTVGSKRFSGEDLGAYIMWPRPDSKKASVAVIAGTGPTGMSATYANQYFAGGSGFPDYMIFSADMLKEGTMGIKCAGYYNNDWSISE